MGNIFEILKEKLAAKSEKRGGVGKDGYGIFRGVGWPVEGSKVQKVHHLPCPGELVTNGVMHW